MEGLSLHLTSSYTILFEDQCGKSKGRCWRWQQYPECANIKKLHFTAEIKGHSLTMRGPTSKAARIGEGAKGASSEMKRSDTSSNRRRSV